MHDVGSRQNGVAYLMDSGYNTDSYRNYSGVFPNPDAVQEFSLQKSNFSAESANATAAIVNVVTRSGTNDFHGSAFLFNRNKIFNARNFFAASRDTLKRNQFGGTFGGPIVKDKLFFFGTYQSTYLRSDPQLSRIFLPTTRMRAGQAEQRDLLVPQADDHAVVEGHGISDRHGAGRREEPGVSSARVLPGGV